MANALFQEVNSALMTSEPGIGLQALINQGKLQQVSPHFGKLYVFNESGIPNLWRHTLDVVNGVPKKSFLRWSALFHDIAKPETFTFSTELGRIVYPEHARLGASIAKNALVRLGVRYAEAERVRALIQSHHAFYAYDNSWSDRVLRRIMDDVFPDIDSLLALCQADITTKRQRGDVLRDKLAEIAQRCAFLKYDQEKKKR